MAIYTGKCTTLTADGDLVGQIISIEGLASSREKIDTTGICDDSMVFKAGIRDNGSVRVSWYHDASDTVMFDLWQSGDVVSFVIENTNVTVTFNGFVSAFNLGPFENNEAVKASAEIVISGTPTLAVTTP